ncbi:hypothetical protein [Actinoplanes awajinensis]|uniref:Uncharacterized protein n=1 Tax=Actinoplanes awajinensis subsp. mycoplanecinus TaxID=135947 RepID=A0A101JR54_9ACTN|nr:hypothetical protein [Actinoplanes awajinensis]KUL31459.1 hypothetical protein ADL15_22260 [Actinoplanes awajinensis subsp. mycoplanecinus]
MIKPAWYSQPFRPDGGITAEGLRNQLGRPALSKLTVLVRESAQNSWDAKHDADVRFKLDLVTVSAAHRQAWVNLLGPNAPMDTSAPRTLPEFLRTTSIRYLAVSDRGTVGLGGPTRSDRFAGANHRAWLSFVLNSGEKQDTDGGGGTYGYGKGAFFLASRLWTVLIYTRFREEGLLRTRLIGSALLTSTTDNGVPLTGRYWWGLPQDDHCEPLIDEDADATARALGLRGFEGQETGTSVIVLDPDLADPSVPEDDESEMSIGEAGRYLADAATWNLWPLMLTDRSPRLQVDVTAHGERIQVASELDDPVIAEFSDAYRRMAGKDGTPIMCFRPKTHLGRFGHRDTFGSQVDSPAAAELGLDGSPHHVCLMRRPDLVVQYLPGQEKAHPVAGYTGVFKVSDDLDATFAKSEPPTHDAWIDTDLTGREATFVRVARKRLLEQCAALAGPKAKEARVLDVPVASVAARLGFLLAGIGGGGAEAALTMPGLPPVDLSDHDESTGTNSTKDPQNVESAPHGDGRASTRTRRGGSTSRRARRPQLIGAPTFSSFRGKIVLAQRVKAFSGARLLGEATVVTGEGATETARPAGLPVPEVLGWLNGNQFTTGPGFDPPDDGAELDLLISPVADAAIDVAVQVARS